MFEAMLKDQTPTRIAVSSSMVKHNYGVQVFIAFGSGRDVSYVFKAFKFHANDGI